jgi:hypothetical protein
MTLWGWEYPMCTNIHSLAWGHLTLLPKIEETFQQTVYWNSIG